MERALEWPGSHHFKQASGQSGTNSNCVPPNKIEREYYSNDIYDIAAKDA